MIFDKTFNEILDRKFFVALFVWPSRGDFSVGSPLELNNDFIFPAHHIVPLLLIPHPYDGHDRIYIDDSSDRP
jgi:hypothetical protein